MAKERQAISHYTKGTMPLTVFFPNDDIKCENCEFCQVERYRAKCLLKHGAIIPLEYLDSIPYDCPLTFDFEKEEG